MNANCDRAFQPGLESLEDRFLLSAARLLFRPTLPRRGLVAALGGAGTAGAVRTIVNPANAAKFTVSIVPRDSSPVGLSQPGTTTIRGFDSGIAEPGLPTPNALAHDPGLSTPGLPFFAPSQPVTPGPIQPGGLVLHPDGSISGNLFM
jgi:hypothetical protein